MFENYQRLVKGIVVLSVCILIVSTYPTLGAYEKTVSRNDERLSVEALDPHPAIWIRNDSHFASLAAIEGWSGDGSEELPYIIEELEISDGSYCINIQQVDSYFIIRNCIFTGLSLSGTGIIIDNSPNGAISDCEIKNADVGIQVYYSDGILIESCAIHFMSEYGIHLNNANNSDIHDTVVYDCRSGLYCNGYQNEHDLEISGCSVFDNSEYGIDAISTETSIIENNLIYGNGFTGISLRKCNSSEITGNTIFDNGVGGYRGAGAYIKESSNVIVSENNISLNYEEGVGLRFSSNAIITNNELCNNSWGLSFSESDSCSAHSNRINYNSNLGIEVHLSPDCEVIENMVIANGKTGIDVNSDDCSILSNQVYDNLKYGLDLDGASNCDIIGNEFGWNLLGNAHQRLSTGSTWSNALGIGNAWSDYAGSGQYSIPGDEGVVDEYPIPLLLIRETPSTVFTPGGNNITVEWETFGLNPHSYELLLDGNKIRDGFWFSGNITFNLTNLSPGSHNLTLIVKDDLNHYVSHSIMFAITDPDSEMPLFVVILISAGVIIGSALILVFFVNKQRLQVQ